MKIKSFSFIPRDPDDSDFNNFMTRILFVSVLNEKWQNPNLCFDCFDNVLSKIIYFTKKKKKEIHHTTNKKCKKKNKKNSTIEFHLYKVHNVFLYKKVIRWCLMQVTLWKVQGIYTCDLNL